MWIFQAPYDAIKRWQARWFCEFMGWVQNSVLWPALKAIGKAGLAYLEETIKEAANIPGTGNAKFKYVFEKMREKFTFEIISDDFLTAIINLIYSQLKAKGEVEARTP